jgi:hypothetical protein
MKRCCLRITPDRLLLEMAPPGPTNHIAAVACRANVDRRGAVGRVLGDERRDVEVAQIIDELVHIVSLVGAPRVRRRDPGEWRTTIVTAASRSIVPVAEPSSATTTIAAHVSAALRTSDQNPICGL